MIARAGVLLLLAAWLAACSTGQPVPEDRFYEVRPDQPGALPAPRLTGGLMLAHVGADPLRNGRAILYRDSGRPLELGRYHYEFWADQPPRMVQAALLDALRASGVADRVESEGYRPHFRYELDVKVRRFESLLGAGRARADVELEATLREGERARWTKVYRRQVDAQAGDMHALADAMRQGLGQIFEAMIGDLKVAETGDR